MDLTRFANKLFTYECQLHTSLEDAVTPLSYQSVMVPLKTRLFFLGTVDKILEFVVQTSSRNEL